MTSEGPRGPVVADRWITDRAPSSRFPFYTRANAGEVLPDPASPLSWSTIWEASSRGWRDSQIGTGLVRPDEVDAEEVVGCFGGYLYINASLARLFGERGPGLTAEAIDRMYFGDHPDVPPYAPEPWYADAEATERLGAWMERVLTDDLDELRADRDETIALRRDRPDLRSLSDHELVERARGLLPLVRRLFERHLTVTGGASIGPGILSAIATALGDPGIALKLITGVGEVDSALPSRAMWALSRLEPGSERYRAAFDDFLVEHGSRGPNEWDLISDVWETRPALAERLIEVMRKQGDDGDPAVRAEAVASLREDVTDRVREALAGDEEASARFEAGLASAHRYLAGRERTKTNVIRVLHEVRVSLREVARRHELSVARFHMLLDDELDAFLASPSDFDARLARRERSYRALFELRPPFIVVGEVPPLTAWPRRADAVSAPAGAPGTELVGVAGCPGTVTGTARVILDPADPTALEPGEILIAPFTDPAWTPLFVPAAGVVVDVGAQVSHAIIVSRELGIPCVVSVTGATETIPDGATVTVDGDAGTVTVH